MKRKTERELEGYASAPQELMQALNDWKNAGGNVADVMLAIERTLQERVPVIIAYFLNQGAKRQAARERKR